MAFRISSTTFLFLRNPRKSIYGGKYTKDHHSSFVFPATRSPSFVIATRSPSFVIATRSPSFVIATMRVSHPTLLPIRTLNPKINLNKIKENLSGSIWSVAPK